MKLKYTENLNLLSFQLIKINLSEIKRKLTEEKLESKSVPLIICIFYCVHISPIKTTNGVV